MSEAHSMPLLSQYSDVFTRLHEGKLMCIRYGMERVALNRFILDSANSTTAVDSSALLSMVDPDLVSDEGSVEDRLAQCRDELSHLVSLQEEVNTLQKVAKEKGITGNYLNIVGQASIQSPEDHGASVIHQLSALMGGGQPAADDAAVTTAAGKADFTKKNDAANDEQEIAGVDAEQSGMWNRFRELIGDQWPSLGVDVMVCFIASIFAIRLVS